MRYMLYLITLLMRHEINAVCEIIDNNIFGSLELTQIIYNINVVKPH